MMETDKITILKQKVYNVIGACMEVKNLMGPFLNEYMYQDALAIELHEQGIPYTKEYYFAAEYKGHKIDHKHFVDFMVTDAGSQMLVECKAIERLGDEQRQQLWNYMRLTGIEIGLLYNFAPIKAQCEKYYYDKNTKAIKAF